MINSLIKDGYKYLIVPKRYTKRFYATKTEAFIGGFLDEDVFDEFEIENDYEKEVLKVFDKNVFIRLGN